MDELAAFTAHIIKKTENHYKIKDEIKIVDSDWLNGILDENFYMLHSYTVRGFQILIPVKINFVELLLAKSNFYRDHYYGVKPFLPVCVFENDWEIFPISSEKEFYEFKEIEYKAFEDEKSIILDCWQDFKLPQ